MPTIQLGLDRGAAIAWYRRIVRAPRRSSMCSPTTRTTRSRLRAPSDRVLRRAPARLQPEHARQEGAGTARASTNRSSACSRAASIRTRPTASAAGRSTWPDRAKRARRSSTRPMRWCSMRSRTADLDVPGHPLLDGAAGGLHHPRARGDAPGNAALHVASAAARSEARAGGLRASSPTAPRRRNDEIVGPARRGAARRRARRDPVRLGQRVRPARASMSTPSRSIVATSPTASSSSSSRTAATRARSVDARRLAWVVEHDVAASGVLGARRRPVALARHVRAPAAAARSGPSTSATRKRAPTRAGAARRLPTEAEYQRAAYGTPGGRAARVSRGATRAPTPAHGVFDFTSWEPQPVGTHPGGPLGLGCRRSRRQRLGVDVDDLRAVPRLSRQPVVSGVLGGLLRRVALRDEGRVAGDRARAAASDASATGSGRAIRMSTRRSDACGRTHDADRRRAFTA